MFKPSSSNYSAWGFKGWLTDPITSYIHFTVAHQRSVFQSQTWKPSEFFLTLRYVRHPLTNFLGAAPVMSSRYGKKNKEINKWWIYFLCPICTHMHIFQKNKLQWNHCIYCKDVFVTNRMDRECFWKHLCCNPAVLKLLLAADLIKPWLTPARLNRPGWRQGIKWMCIKHFASHHHCLILSFSSVNHLQMKPNPWIFVA